MAFQPIAGVGQENLINAQFAGQLGGFAREGITQVGNQQKVQAFEQQLAKGGEGLVEFARELGVANPDGFKAFGSSPEALQSGYKMLIDKQMKDQEVQKKFDFDTGMEKRKEDAFKAEQERKDKAFKLSEKRKSLAFKSEQERKDAKAKADLLKKELKKSGDDGNLAKLNVTSFIKDQMANGSTLEESKQSLREILEEFYKPKTEIQKVAIDSLADDAAQKIQADSLGTQAPAPKFFGFPSIESVMDGNAMQEQSVMPSRPSIIPDNITLPSSSTNIQQRQPIGGAGINLDKQDEADRLLFEKFRK